MKVVGHGVTVSLDGYVAGPDQSYEDPLGVGGEGLHEWAMATKVMRQLHGMDGGDEGIDNIWARLSVEGVGATIMGRNMFGPVRGPWDASDWNGWWGDSPPFHHPVFVLTHHPRASIEMDGGTVFHFVTDGIEEALRRARVAAGERDVRVSGGASTIRQYLEAALIDELHLAVVPQLLGSGARLFDGALGSLPREYECTRFEASDRVCHVLLARRA